jgi:hypothetical protein
MAKVRVNALKSESNLKLHAMKLAFFMNIRSWVDEHRLPLPENIGSWRYEHRFVDMLIK